MKILQAVLVSSMAGLFMSPAVADDVFEFAFAGPHVSGFATLQVRPDGHGGYVAVSGHGTETIGSETETLTLVPGGSVDGEVSPAGAFLFDNRIIGPLLGLTQYGLLFDTPTQEINIAALADGGYAYFKQDLYSEATGIAFAMEAGAVPEPGTAALLLLGLPGLLLHRASRRRPRDLRA